MTTPHEALQCLTDLDNKLNVAISLLRSTTHDHDTLARRLPTINAEFVRACLITSKLPDELAHVKDPTPPSSPSAYTSSSNLTSSSNSEAGEEEKQETLSVEDIEDQAEHALSDIDSSWKSLLSFGLDPSIEETKDALTAGTRKALTRRRSSVTNLEDAEKIRAQAQRRLQELQSIANYFSELMKGLQLDPSPSTSPRDADFKFDRSLMHGACAELHSGLNKESINALRQSAIDKKTLLIFRIPKPHERAESQMAALDVGVKLGEYQKLLDEKRHEAYQALIADEQSLEHAPPKILQTRINLKLESDEELAAAKKTLDAAIATEQKRLKRMHIKDKSMASGIFISRQQIEARGIRMLEDGVLHGTTQEKYKPIVNDEDGHQIEFIALPATFTDHDIRMMLKAGLIARPKKDSSGNVEIRALNGSFTYILKQRKDSTYKAITEDGSELCRLHEFDPKDQNFDKAPEANEIYKIFPDIDITCWAMKVEDMPDTDDMTKTHYTMASKTKAAVTGFASREYFNIAGHINEKSPLILHGDETLNPDLVPSSVENLVAVTPDGDFIICKTAEDLADLLLSAANQGYITYINPRWALPTESMEALLNHPNVIAYPMDKEGISTSFPTFAVHRTAAALQDVVNELILFKKFGENIRDMSLAFRKLDRTITREMTALTTKRLDTTENTIEANILDRMINKLKKMSDFISQLKTIRASSAPFNEANLLVKYANLFPSIIHIWRNQRMAQLYQIINQHEKELTPQQRNRFFSRSHALHYQAHFKLQKMDCNNNALFAAIADQLNFIYDQDHSAESLKAMAMHFIINNPTEFGRDETLESLCETIATDRIKADQILLKAIARSLDLTVEIHQSNGQKSNIGEGDRSIYLGYLMGERWLSFRPNPEMLSKIRPEPETAPLRAR